MAPPLGNDVHTIRSDHRHTRRSVLAGLAAFGALGAAGCTRVASASGKDGGDLLERLARWVSYGSGSPGEIPFGYIDRNGRLTGEAPELARVIFKRLGVDRVQPVPTEFGSLIPGLKSQQFDVVAAGMYVTPDRCEQVIFADPDYQMPDAFIVPKGNPLGLRTYADALRAHAKVATGTGYAQIQHAVEAGYRENDLVIVPDQVAGLNAVESGRVDLFAATAVTARLVARGSAKAESTKPFVALVDGKPKADGGAFAFRPTETRLRDAFNAELHKLRRSGELYRIVRPFGFTKAEMTTLTAKELCG
ncbi:ectoine/hydroxyectoine ABC transporter substrate-binding protein EhuB [Streptomyces tricolor]|nr:ectoine/hydroxyectoine ABC transporter substrate-binding protein EhuB [Streptomyces tricolor]